jgi:hypothetical protein
MDLKFESREGFLLATAAGQVSLNEALELCKNVRDVSEERGFSKILLDCRGMEGELSVMERYEIGKTLAEYCLSRSMSPAVALVGKPPTITGFGAEVARNRGLLVMTFPEIQPALDWIRGFGSKAITQSSPR